ncbi:uncharacterized protein PV07_06531 [Cladophialophora immunda]|uniref:Uncharacterized protein n=1 Tax=Cladophialophora immunda TaxID=569365 RepID=A0A0D2C8A6_9EURO|nr:uncharacterized protein PV07_06531 [Cladophialophora immunda]KIW26720.1 hypothetical protein PV07_06531 [Cladophialophora immunda]OQV01992.1 Sel1 repeat-containing protein [Cladophialophora immunda]
MMAGNQYGQQWQQNPTPSSQYDGGNNQRQWQENGRGQGPYNQDNQRYNDYPKSRNGYGPGQAPALAPTGYARNAQWEGQNQYHQQSGHEAQYYENGEGYSRPSQPSQYDQGPPPSRQYQYDERYRTQGPGRPPQPDHGYANAQRPPRNQWSEPSTPQKRSRARDRILTEPTSPKNLAWDNPFGAFPPKKKPGDKMRHERHASLDHAMASLDMNEHHPGGGFEARPHTSNSQRKEPPRPSTSHDRHDRHPDIGQPPLPTQGYPMPPSRNSPEMTYQQPPMPRPQGGMGSPRMRPAGPPRGPPPPMNRNGPRPGPQGGMEDFNPRANYNAPGNYPLPDRRGNNNVYDEGYASDFIPQSRAHISPIDRAPQGYQSRPPAQEDYHANSNRGFPPNGSAETTQLRSSQIPNFDAIPTGVNEKTEDHMIANQPSGFGQNIYQKPTYQVPGSFPSQIDTKQSISPPNQTTSPLAEFSFDLPGSSQPAMAGRNDSSAQGASYRGVYTGQETFGAGGPPRGVYGDIKAQDPPGAQYPPPRTASRNGIKPSMESDASRPPLPNNGQPYRSFSQDQYPIRPHTSNAQRPPQQSYEMMNPYDQDYGPVNRAPSAPAAPPGPVPSDQSYVYPGQGQQYQQPYGQGPPLRKASQDNYNGGPVRPNASNSAHPVPVRHYPAPNAETNPDALPAHPTPVRAGLKDSNGYPANQTPPAQPNQRREVSGSSPPVTAQELNSLREMYSRNPGDHALGLKLAKKMVEAARVLSDENGMADQKTTQKNREKYIFDAHKLIKKLVAASYPDAMFYLADCYGQGMLGLAVDPKEAFSLYQSAAKLNHPQSAYRVAVCCELGTEEGGGTRRDPLKAMQWYKRAATLGDTPAMYKMGMILLKGLLGQQKNPREAVSWLKRAAERADKDNPHALHELGLIYESASSTDHIVRDEKYAFQLFQQAAELGYKYSQFRLGSAYEYGLLGCPIDARQSIAWYTRAAAQGEHQSELALSGWYLTGSEPLLTQSDTEAFLWARKAASSGLAKAEYAMGYFNEVGIGTPGDIEEAKRWYYRAAAQNFPKARERLEELKRGGPKQQKTRVSRSNVNRQTDGDCVVM